MKVFIVITFDQITLQEANVSILAQFPPTDNYIIKLCGHVCL